MIGRALILALALAALVWPQAGDAQTTALRKLDTENAAQVWRAVGRIDLGRQGFCSGTLIAPDLVLTAAHCLYRPGSGQLWKTGDIVFRAGLRDGSAVLSRRISALVAHPGFQAQGPLDMQNVAHDVGLLKLAEPVSTFEIPPFRLLTGRAAPGPVSVVSYGRGRADAQSRQSQCQMMEHVQGVMVFDCDVTFGSSGAPVFVHQLGRNHVVSLISGMVAIDGRKLSVGMDLPQRVAELKRQLRVSREVPKARIKRLVVGQGRSGTGAKFVRPDSGS